jgi:hypothetical protein
VPKPRHWTVLLGCAIAVIIAVAVFDGTVALIWPAPHSVCVVTSPVAPTWTARIESAGNLFAVVLTVGAAGWLILTRKADRRG